VKESWGEPRTKTVTWYDPLKAAAAGATLSGRDYLQAMLDGELPPPPISGLMGFQPVSLGDGIVTFTCTPDESAYNPIGVVHGGLVCTLLDTVIGCAVSTTLAVGIGYTSLEIKTSFLRPVRAGEGALTATGRVTKPGRRAAFADGEVRDTRGQLVATATSTCLVFPL
jgi:uncharacterized protein (TIGR00369 family)